MEVDNINAIPLLDEHGPPVYFPLLTLAPEIISCILKQFYQNQVLTLRLVNRKLRDLVDELYGFKFNIYDETERLNGIKKLKCEKITIWKLIVPIENHLFDRPSHIKTLEVNGPVTELNLQKLITPCVNLEKISVIRRANYPWILTLRDTPGLVNLKKLKTLLMNSEESKVCRLDFVNLPLMDCYFPCLTHFDIVKGFHIRQYSTYVGSVLKFVSLHCETLQHLKMCMLARRNLCFFPPDDTDLELNDNSRSQALQHQGNIRLISSDIQLEKLCRTNLSRVGITTQGYAEDINIWAEFLKSQLNLLEFRFDWSRVDSGDNAWISGFPWTVCETPILKSSTTLVSVELNNLSVFVNDINGLKRLTPINLSVFSCCNSLEHLTIANTESSSEGLDDPSPLAEGQSVVVNCVDLPPTLFTFRLEGFPTKSIDLEAVIRKCSLLQSVTMKDLGDTHDLGISAAVIKAMSSLNQLKYVQLVDFNTSTPQNLHAIQTVFHLLDISYEGKHTWLRLWSDVVSASEIMRRLA